MSQAGGTGAASRGASAYSLVLKLHYPYALLIAACAVLIVLDKEVVEVVAGFAFLGSEALFHQREVAAVDYLPGAFAGILIIFLTEVYFCEQMQGSPLCELAGLYGIGIHGEIVDGKFKVIDHMRQQLGAGSAGEVEHKRLLNGLYPRRIAIEIMEIAVTIGADTPGIGLIM